MSRGLPPVPANTCPEIDNVIEGLDASEKAFKALDAIDFSGLRHLMEQLREANDALRQNYEHQLERADDLQKELDTANTDKDSAEATVTELRAEIKALEEAAKQGENDAKV